MNDDRGQALIVSVVVLAIAAVAIGGLRLAQDRILAAAREHRAGEAAAEAATAVVADAYAAELRRVAESSASPRPTADAAGAVTAPRTRENARVAASDMSLQNGAASIDDLFVRCADAAADVTVVLHGRSYRAGFGAPLCSQR